jgi:hypothetical protein
MICLTNGLPCLADQHGELSEIPESTLLEAMVSAAAQAGYAQWWLAGHVLESVFSYLRDGYTANSIGYGELEQLMKSALQVIGYGDVADLLVLSEGDCKISLLDLANRADCGYELAFFNLLEERLRDAMNAQVRRFELVDLEQCIKKLRSSKTWNRRCETLRAEIVSYVRLQVMASQEAQQVRLTLR